MPAAPQLPDWLISALASTAAQPLGQRVGHFFEHLYNEIHHGSGQTDLSAVTKALIHHADLITDLFTPRPKPDAAPSPKAAAKG